ncbi:MAG: gamma-glutamylcyclotransferase [Brevinematales bacterium]
MSAHFFCQLHILLCVFPLDCDTTEIRHQRGDRVEGKVDKIFVYGTLDKVAFFSNFINTEEIKYVGRGRIQAKLYDLGEYLGAVEHGESYVYGRVYEVQNIDKVLPFFDEHEEFYPDKPERSLFI